MSRVLLRFPGLSVATLAALVHARTLTLQLTNWDDGRYVVHNPFVGRGLAGLADALTRPFDGAWYPLTQGVAVAALAPTGSAPWAIHAVQVAIFVAAAGLLPRALRAASLPPAVALCTAALWVVHPFRPESVSWAANLKDTLSVLGVIATGACLRAGRRGAAAVCFGAALLAKSMVFPVAGLVVLREWLGGRTAKSAVLRSLPFLVPALVIAVLAARLHLGAAEAEPRAIPGGSWPVALANAVFLPWWYLGRILWPVDPRAIYDFHPTGPTDARFAAAALLWLALWGVHRSQGPRGRVVLGAMAAAFVLPLIPVLGLVPIAFLVADRYTLLPSLVPLAALGWTLVAWGERGPRHRALAAGATVVLLAAWAGASVVRQGQWRDGVHLWEANRSAAPESWAVRVNLAGAYGGERRWSEAIAELEAARRLDPTARRTVADLYFARAAREGMPVQRIQEHVRELRKAGRQPRALLDVAVATLREGYPDAAGEAARAALYDDDRADAHDLLARVAARQGDPASSLAQAEAALRLDPAFAPATVTRALALVRLGRLEDALSATGHPLADRPQNGRLQSVRAYALYRLGRVPEARAALDAAARDLPSAPGLEDIIRQLDDVRGGALVPAGEGGAAGSVAGAGDVVPVSPPSPPGTR